MQLRRVLATAAALALALSTGMAGASSARRGLEGVPRFEHIVVLTLENESESVTFAAASPAHYLNALRSRGVFLPNYYGTGHASLDNYVAMVSGQPETPWTGSDCETFSLFECAQFQSLFAGGRNLGDQLDAAHVSWRSYMDGTSVACFHGPYSPTNPSPDPYQGNTRKPPGYDYADRHNPFIVFPDFVGNAARCAAHQKPYRQLAGDLTRNRLPAFAFITPDTCHDGHDNPCSDGKPGGLVSADAWLRTAVPPLLSYLWHHNGLLIINVDEGSTSSTAICPTCASGGLGGQVGAVLLSRQLRPGVVTVAYDHDSLLRTIEDAFGISEHLNLAANAAPMTAVFARG